MSTDNWSLPVSVTRKGKLLHVTLGYGSAMTTVDLQEVCQLSDEETSYLVAFLNRKETKVQPARPYLEAELREGLHYLVMAWSAEASQLPPQVGYLSEAISELETLRCEHKALENTRGVLERLVHYYSSRARSARRAAVKELDCRSLADQAMNAAAWEARKDAVLKVAENLGIVIDDPDENEAKETKE